MKSLPITPGLTPPSSPSQTAPTNGVNANSGAGASGASADGNSAQGGAGGQNFNDVLARQMASPESKLATTTVVARVPTTDSNLLKSVGGDKTDEKTGSDTPDAAAGTQASVAALMGLPLVPGQAPPATTAQAPVIATGSGSPQPSFLGGQATASLLASGFHSMTAAPERSAVTASEAQPPLPSVVNPQESFSRSLQQAVDQTAPLITGAAADTPLQSHDGHVADGAAVVPIQSQGAAQLLMSYAPAPGAGGQQTISSPVGSSRWGDELGQKITWMTTQTDHSAELHLNPPDLGPLKVVLHVSGDQASAFFTSPHAAVREAVSQALPRLRDMLADNGIMLGNTSVSDQGGQGAQNAFTGSGGQQSTGSSGNGAIEVSSVPSGARVASPRISQGLVDTFA